MNTEIQIINNLITTIKILGSYFLILIGICFYIIAKRLKDLEKYIFELEKRQR